MVTIKRTKLENNTLKDSFSVASFIYVNYYPPFNFELHKTCHFNSSFVNLTNSMWTAVYVCKTCTNVEGDDESRDDRNPVSLSLSLSLCTIIEFQNTQAYFTLHLMVTTPGSGKSYATITC